MRDSNNLEEYKKLTLEIYKPANPCEYFTEELQPFICEILDAEQESCKYDLPPLATDCGKFVGIDNPKKTSFIKWNKN